MDHQPLDRILTVSNVMIIHFRKFPRMNILLKDAIRRITIRIITHINVCLGWLNICECVLSQSLNLIVTFYANWFLVDEINLDVTL
jgi:hypothetical protein